MLAPRLLGPAAMRAPWLLVWSVLAVACASDDFVDDPGDDAWLDGKADGASSVDIAATHLDVHLADRNAVATLELEKAGSVALEAGGLHVSEVRDDRGKRHYRIVDGKLLVANVRGALVVAYSFDVQHDANGLLPGGSTVIWPYFCGNLFPCHSRPADGTRFTLALDGVPQGETAVYPAAIDAEAPPYMLAFATGAYGKQQLGTTSAGTTVSVYWLPGGKTKALAGTKHLAAIFDWYERTLGPYQFGSDVASVSVVWGEGLFGGMEHHPFWHVADGAMDNEETHAHEAAHGWFGDGIRLRCWEDFVLSEGTVSYLAARSIGQVVGSDAEAAIWREYAGTLGAAVQQGGAPAWPSGCNQIDILKDKLFTNLPYMEGAYFYKDVAAQVGADVLDGVLSRFYLAHRGQPAGMQDMIDAIRADTGFDPSALVEQRLRKQF